MHNQNVSDLVFLLSLVICAHFCSSVITGGGDGMTRVYDAKNGTLKLTVKGHAGVVNAIQVLQ